MILNVREEKSWKLQNWFRQSQSHGIFCLTRHATSGETLWWLEHKGCLIEVMKATSQSGAIYKWFTNDLQMTPVIRVIWSCLPASSYWMIDGFRWLTYLFTLRENEELTRVKECQTSRKEELRALRSIFHCEIQKKKNWEK